MSLPHLLCQVKQGLSGGSKVCELAQIRAVVDACSSLLSVKEIEIVGSFGAQEYVKRMIRLIIDEHGLTCAADKCSDYLEWYCREAT